MPGINRTLIITGPALVQYGGQSFWSKGDISVKPTHRRFNVESAAFGTLETRVADRRILVTFEPDGRFTAGVNALLWPYANPSVGSSIFGGSDSALVIWGRDGIKVTILNAALTKMPNLRLGVGKTVVGPVEFTGLVANSTAGTAEGDYFTVTTAAYPGDVGYAVADIPTSGISMSWKGGVAPWANNFTADGAEISFALRLQEQAVDGLGTVDMRLVGVDVSARATPVGPTAAQILTAHQPSGALGAAASGSDLVFTSAITGAPVVTLKNAIMTETGLLYGPAAKRIGPCAWQATRPFSGTPLLPAALFSVALA
jgi:hypothetical protein